MNNNVRWIMIHCKLKSGILFKFFTDPLLKDTMLFKTHLKLTSRQRAKVWIIVEGRCFHLVRLLKVHSGLNPKERKYARLQYVYKHRC